ncbi:MAG: low molecular weight phosphotyrosine protein phosphatase [Deltaproteobacteria bacterium]|nr:low molecular weight phosphotyrosine protein phosphatase [Deltaproteobacteria bacterium]
MIKENKKFKVIFVCLGNICRSPVAHGVFEDIVNKAGFSNDFEIDSAGTAAYHQGEMADRRMRETARGHNIEITHLARKIKKEDLDYFDMVLAMDSQNLFDLQSLAQNKEQLEKIILFRTYDPLANGQEDVPDPYYGGSEGFENVYYIVSRTGKILLDKINENKALR